MKKIKIGYIINSVKNCGPVNVLINMLYEINYDNYEVSVVTILNDNDISYINKIKNINSKIKIIEMKYEKSITTLLKANEITKKINKYKFDIIHVHGHITAILCQKVLAKKIITVHNKMYEDFRETYGPIKGWIINTFYISAMKKYDKVICCSESSYNVCKKYLPDCTFVRNGITMHKCTDLQKRKIKKKIRNLLGIPLNGKIYLYAGSLNTRKNVIQMADFYSKSLKKDEYLVILGEGNLQKELEKYQNKNIKIIGFQSNVYDYLIASDVYTSFSISEGLPMSIIEALSVGLLLLVSNIDSHKEIFNIDKTYYIGEFFSLSSLESFKNHKSKVDNANKNGSIIFQTKYLSSKAMMESYEKWYRIVLNN